MNEEKRDRSFNFTLQGKSMFEDTVGNLMFPEADANMILQALQSSFRVVPFCEYLKRYLYQKTGFTGSYRSIPLEEYVETLTEAFRETATPATIKRGNSRLSTRARSWLQQQTATRQVVLMLGFGLSMSIQDVNDFLTKAIHDYQLDESDPLEAICACCYRNQYRYSKMEYLWELWQDFLANGFDASKIRDLQPQGRAQSEQVIQQDTQLLQGQYTDFTHAQAFPTVSAGQGDESSGTLPVTASNRGRSPNQLKIQQQFMLLYERVCHLIQQMRGLPADAPIHPHDVEDVLCAGIPRNQHGNLIPKGNIHLQEELFSRRMSRQHLRDLLRGLFLPNRFDLITLRFFLCMQPEELELEPANRYHAFVQDMNRILTSCGYGELYAASPYECFVLMCVLSIDPLATYTEVQELSYAGT